MEKLKVLLVDDEEELVYTLEERLQLRGIDAEGVTSGEEALKRLQEKEFNVVILDVKMPGMKGLDVLEEIKRDYPTTEVILLTGRGSIKESQDGIKAGAFDYLIKPVNIDDLIAKMRDAIGNKIK